MALSKEIVFPYIDHEKELFIETTLKKFLELIGKTSLFSNMSYILKEMVGNANKANLKRIHFQLKKLDINSNIHYEEGIKTFKEELSLYSNKYISEANRLGFYVKINLSIENNFFKMTIINNSKLLPIEKKRIESKFQKASKFNNIEEALSEGLDQIEGAGFGLILTLLMLRKLGLEDNLIKILTYNERETYTEIMIPLHLLNKEQEQIIADIIKNEISEIPQFPDHILKLQSKLNDPNADFSAISSIINRDPSLIADLLKTANSCMYMLPNKIKTIDEAVRQIGFKGIKNLIFTYSMQKILAEKFNYNLIKETIDHSSEIAFYSYEMAKLFKYKDIIDEIFTAAILHDIGKIIINSLKPNILDKIIKICNDKGISTDIIENLTDGFNHSIIGAKLAELWNFPDHIIETIKYHHIPLESKEQNRRMIYIIYLANILYYYNKNEFTFNNINYQVIKFFNLTDKINFDRTFQPLIKQFISRKNEL